MKCHEQSYMLNDNAISNIENTEMSRDNESKGVGVFINSYKVKYKNEEKKTDTVVFGIIVRPVIFSTCEQTLSNVIVRFQTCFNQMFDNFEIVDVESGG